MIIALEVWGSDFDQVLATCQRAERLGFDAFYYGESPHDLNLECWTTLAALARATSRIRLGPVISNNLPAYRSTALLARQVGTVARIANGRLDFRTGVGASAAFGRPWWEPHGVVYPGYDQRLADLRDALDILSRLWSAPPDRGTPPVTAPIGVPVPVTVAATGRRAMELAAARADVWETSFCTPAQMAQRVATMAQLAAGRPIIHSLEIDGFVAATPGALGRLIDQVRADRAGGEDLEPVLTRALTGPPSDVATQIRALAAVGVDQLVVALHDPHDPDALEALAEAVDQSPEEAPDRIG